MNERPCSSEMDETPAFAKESPDDNSSWESPGPQQLLFKSDPLLHELDVRRHGDHRPDPREVSTSPSGSYSSRPGMRTHAGMQLAPISARSEPVSVVTRRSPFGDPGPWRQHGAVPLDAPLWKPPRLDHAFQQHYKPLEHARQRRMKLGPQALQPLQWCPQPFAQPVWASRMSMTALRRVCTPSTPMHGVPDRYRPSRRVCPCL